MSLADLVPAPMQTRSARATAVSIQIGHSGGSPPGVIAPYSLPDSAPAASTPGPVWSAGTVTGQDQRPQAPQDIKGSTLLWGAFLLLIGGLLIAAGLGLRFDFTTTAIACLAGLGGLLVVEALIPVLDEIELARQHGDLTGTFETTAGKLEAILADKFGLVRFGEVGEVFDPTIHEALMATESDEVSEPSISLVLQPGYRLGERIVRAARVQVANPA